MAHTPGPWRVDSVPYVGNNVCHAIVAGEHQIAEVHPGDSASVEIAAERHAANARLIAAAPDMLAALEFFVKLDNLKHSASSVPTSDWADCHLVARAAVAKARGE